MAISSLKDAIVEFLLEEDGPTVVEYAVMLALIVAVCLTSIGALSAKTAESFDATATAIDSALGN
jgi:pilus assembly protein Flp/PilA